MLEYIRANISRSPRSEIEQTAHPGIVNHEQDHPADILDIHKIPKNNCSTSGSKNSS